MDANYIDFTVITEEDLAHRNETAHQNEVGNLAEQNKPVQQDDLMHQVEDYISHDLTNDGQTKINHKMGVLNRGLHNPEAHNQRVNTAQKMTFASSRHVQKHPGLGLDKRTILIIVFALFCLFMCLSNLVH